MVFVIISLAPGPAGISAVFYVIPGQFKRLCPDPVYRGPIVTCVGAIRPRAPFTVAQEIWKKERIGQQMINCA